MKLFTVQKGVEIKEQAYTSLLDVCKSNNIPYKMALKGQRVFVKSATDFIIISEFYLTQPKLSR